MEDIGSQKTFLNFGELASDEEFTRQINGLDTSIDNVGISLQAICGSDAYSKLSTSDKVKYDLFMAYSLNSLYWMYLRTQGCDPNESGIKNELIRVQAIMSRTQKVDDRKKVMPRIDKQTAARFIRSGLWVPTKPSTDLQGNIILGPSNVKQPKKKIFVDDDNVSAASDSSNIRSTDNANANEHPVSPPVISKTARKRQRRFELKHCQFIKGNNAIHSTNAKSNSKVKSKKVKKVPDCAESNDVISKPIAQALGGFTKKKKRKLMKLQQISTSDTVKNNATLLGKQKKKKHNQDVNEADTLQVTLSKEKEAEVNKSEKKKKKKKILVKKVPVDCLNAYTPSTSLVQVSADESSTKKRKWSNLNDFLPNSVKVTFPGNNKKPLVKKQNRNKTATNSVHKNNVFGVIQLD